MLFKLSLRNIRRSLRDYAIYFFTLIIGISVFYVFNAIGSQTAMMKMSASKNEIIKLLVVILSGTSVFVAGVLGLLIVYATRFLIKRRSKEFAMYMMLGMSKGSISAILLAETVLIGIGSLAAGLILGVGLSQLMSALVASLFEVDMSTYRFTVSFEAVGKTVLYFAVMYVVVMIFNSFVVTKMKLIDLIRSGRQCEQIKLKNPAACVLIFLISAAALGFAYYQVGWHAEQLKRDTVLMYIAIGCISTFLIFWSVSGMLLRVLMRMKNIYHHGLNSFTFRQLSSKVNTMVFSMTVICLMLFVTICSLTSAFAIRNSMNKNLRELCPADAEIMINYRSVEGPGEPIPEKLSAEGYDISEKFSEHISFYTYCDPDFTFEVFLGSNAEEIKSQYKFLMYNNTEEFISLSDYNALMQLYGREQLTLADNEYILLCNYFSMKNIRDSVMSDITVFGRTFTPKYTECYDGFIDLSAERSNSGIYIVPDFAVQGAKVDNEYLFANYSSEDDTASEEEFTACCERFSKSLPDELYVYYATKQIITDTSLGLGVIVTFMGMYIGLVFLISCGAVLGLKQLSDCTDSIPRYDMLRKIGAEESDITRSLFTQTGLFFLLPLLLAIVHSVFGMKFSVKVMEFVGTENISRSIALTSVILLLIYGGYFLVTCLCSKNIIKDRK